MNMFGRVRILRRNRSSSTYNDHSYVRYRHVASKLVRFQRKSVITNKRRHRHTTTSINFCQSHEEPICLVSLDDTDDSVIKNGTLYVSHLIIFQNHYYLLSTRRSTNAIIRHKTPASSPSSPKFTTPDYRTTEREVILRRRRTSRTFRVYTTAVLQVTNKFFSLCPSDRSRLECIVRGGYELS